MVARLEMGVSWQAKQLQEYDRPFPIYTAVAVKEVEPDAEAGELGGLQLLVYEAPRVYEALSY
jgi:hypothetical protein